MHTDISGARWIWAKVSGSRLCETLMLACLWHPSSSRPDKKVSLRTRSAIRCLKSHLRLLHSSCCSFLPPSFCPSGHLICQPRTSPSPAAAARATDTFIVLLFLTLMLLHPTRSHLPPAQDTGPWVLCLPRRGPFIRRSARPSEPLIPSSLHPVTKEWLGQRGYRAPVVRGSVSSRARQNQRR